MRAMTSVFGQIARLKSTAALAQRNGATMRQRAKQIFQYLPQKAIAQNGVSCLFSQTAMQNKEVKSRTAIERRPDFVGPEGHQGRFARTAKLEWGFKIAN
jgi:hypothetical protein